MKAIYLSFFVLFSVICCVVNARQNQKDVHDYANIIFWFQVMYAIGYIVAAKIVVSVDAKIGYGVAVLCGSAYVIAIILFHWLSPKLKRIEI